MLDGGYKEWQKNGYTVETKSNPYQHSISENTINPKILATYKDIIDVLKKKDNKAILIDTRSNSEFNGSVLRAAKAGHIPNAINVDWSENIENGFFKVSEKLRKMYIKHPKKYGDYNVLSRRLQGS